MNQQFEFNGHKIRWRTPSAPEILAEDLYKVIGKPVPLETDTWIDIHIVHGLVEDNSELKEKLDEEIPVKAASIDTSY